MPVMRFGFWAFPPGSIGELGLPALKGGNAQWASQSAQLDAFIPQLPPGCKGERVTRNRVSHMLHTFVVIM